MTKPRNMRLVEDEEVRKQIYLDLMHLGKIYKISPEEIVEILKEYKPIYTREELEI